MEEKKPIIEDPTIEQLQEIIKDKDASLQYWMQECLKIQKKYDNLKQLIKSLIVIID